jgi:hypothetical protein
MPYFREAVYFYENFCYPAGDERIWLQEEKPWEKGTRWIFLTT